MPNPVVRTGVLNNSANTAPIGANKKAVGIPRLNKAHKTKR